MQEQIKNLGEDLKAYAGLRLQIAKLQIADKSSDAAALTTFSIIATLLILMVLVFLSAGFALYMSLVLGSLVKACLLTASIYLVISLLVFVFRKALFISPMKNLMLKQLLKPDRHGN